MPNNPGMHFDASVGTDPHCVATMLMDVFCFLRHVTSLYQKSCTCARKNAATSSECSEYGITMQTCACRKAAAFE